MKYLSLAIIIASVSSFPVICVIFAMKSKCDSLEMDMGAWVIVSIIALFITAAVMCS